MSMEYSYYVIIGYDITQMIIETEALSEWAFEDGSKYFDYGFVNNVQIFNDPAENEHVYLGKIIWCAEEFNYQGNEIRDFDSNLMDKHDCEKINEIFEALRVNGFVDIEARLDDKPKLICFVEWT